MQFGGGDHPGAAGLGSLKRCQSRRLLEQIGPALGRPPPRRSLRGQLDPRGDLAVGCLGTARQVIGPLFVVLEDGWGKPGQEPRLARSARRGRRRQVS